MTRLRFRPSAGSGAWWGWAGALFILYALFALARHHNLGTSGFDLGIFTQAVHGYANFGALRSDLKGWGFNLYGDHFHPILVLLVPFYWLRPGAQTLLVAQAALLAVATVPLARLAARRLGRAGGHAVAAAYGLSTGVQGALAFDFHEVAFAAPLLAYSLTALAEGRYRAATWWALPLLAVKEELALTVAVIGLVLVVRRQRRLGLALFGAGLLCFAVVVGALIPAFNPNDAYPYFSVASGEGDLSDVRGLAQRLAAAPKLMFLPSEKTTTLLLLGALTCGLAVGSPLALVALPNICVRFLSDSPLYWGTGLQYNLTLMPILFAAALDAQPKWARSTRPLVRGLGRHTAAALLVAAAPLAPTAHLQNFLLHPVTAFTTTPHARAAHALMRRIPDGAVVEATNNLAPHLAHRTRVFTWPLTDHPPQWAVIDLDMPWPVSPDAHHARADDLIERGFQLVDAQDNVALLHHPGAP
ncbi:DUF2079 domain-containing protein [Streptomyces sp. NPDC051907]|uniref:DUF2079 domain-containing protein n=1 Tax=Streptomyces sp. NPDC051907 TaxID=3155284 RepID=UPI003423AA8D